MRQINDFDDKNNEKGADYSAPFLRNKWLIALITWRQEQP